MAAVEGLFHSPRITEINKLEEINAALVRKNRNLELENRKLVEALDERDEKLNELQQQISELKKHSGTNSLKQTEKTCASSANYTTSSKTERLHGRETQVAELTKKLRYQTKLIEALATVSNIKDCVQQSGSNLTTKPRNGLDTNDLQSESLSLQTPSLFLPETNLFVSKDQSSTQINAQYQSKCQALNIPIDTEERNKLGARKKTPKHQQNDPCRKRTKVEVKTSEISTNESKVSNIEQTDIDENEVRILCEDKTESISDTLENIPGTSYRQCPCCFGDFTKFAQEQFEAHVLECLENQLYKDSKPRDAEITREELRTCPICNMVLPPTLGQTEYELHVLRHIEVSDMQYEEIHHKEAEQIPVTGT